MPSDELPRTDAELDQLNASLNDGLQCCRSVMANYKSLLAANDPAAANDDDGDVPVDSAQDRT